MQHSRLLGIPSPSYSAFMHSFRQVTAENKFHSFLSSCLANENGTTRRCSGQPLIYSHLLKYSPLPSTLRQLCGRHFNEYYQLQTSMASSFTGCKLCGERFKSLDYRQHIAWITTPTSSSGNCSPFHIYLLNTFDPSSPNSKKKQSLNLFRNQQPTYTQPG